MYTNQLHFPPQSSDPTPRPALTLVRVTHVAGSRWWASRCSRRGRCTRRGGSPPCRRPTARTGGPRRTGSRSAWRCARRSDKGGFTPGKSGMRTFGWREIQKYILTTTIFFVPGTLKYGLSNTITGKEPNWSCTQIKSFSQMWISHHMTVTLVQGVPIL